MDVIQMMMDVIQMMMDVIQMMMDVMIVLDPLPVFEQRRLVMHHQASLS